jgi:hypothetical protein
LEMVTFRRLTLRFRGSFFSSKLVWAAQVLKIRTLPTCRADSEEP